MDHYHGCNPYSRPVPNPGLAGILVGIVNLTGTALQGGANLIRTVVEGTMWHSGGHHDHCCCEPHHCCCYECRPSVHHNCGHCC